VYLAGEPAADSFVIGSGAVKLSAASRDGRENVTAILGTVERDCPHFG